MTHNENPHSEDFTSLDYPFDPHQILLKKRILHKSLVKKKDLLSFRVAILGGSTTSEIKDILEIFLLHNNIKPEFYESDYNQFAEEACFPSEKFLLFKPDLIYIHTNLMNLKSFPKISSAKEEVETLLQNIFDKYTQVWDSLHKNFNAPVIQNNFEAPLIRLFGNLDAVDFRGKCHFISELNKKFSQHAVNDENLYIHDINYLSSWMGLERWFDRRFWYHCKYAISYQAIPHLCHSLSSMINSICGKNKKVLVLDLDNTLWGGVIGDDGVDNIALGPDTPKGETFLEFQEYIRELKDRGIILAVSSKNEFETAKSGFGHPNSVLKLNDFASFKANWDPKNEIIAMIAKEINLGEDSLVFIDDNPAERNLVRSQLPAVKVLNVGEDPSRFIDILNKSGLFETVAISTDDLKRNDFYLDNSRREEAQKKFASYDEYLESLQMEAEIAPFDLKYLDRIYQLTNKTNQFNLTTKRFSFSEFKSFLDESKYISLYAKLNDKFGNNGLISVLLGEIRENSDLHLLLWLMSCRVFNRGVPEALFDCLVTQAESRGIKRIYGYYCSSKKNLLVKNHYKNLGFYQVSEEENGDSYWCFDLKSEFKKLNKFVKVIYEKRTNIESVNENISGHL